MIHSILPPEIIMGQAPGLDAYPQVQHFAVQNGYVRAIRDTAGQVRVESLFSTDPHDYLDPRYQPGSPWR